MSDIVDTRSPELAYVTKTNIAVPVTSSPKPSEIPALAAKRDSDNIGNDVTSVTGGDTVHRQRKIRTSA